MNYTRQQPEKNFQPRQGESNSMNTHLKQQLINYIYSTVELSNFKYKIIEYDSDLPLLLKQKHFVSANFSGSNCLLVFIKIRDKFYSYLVDRKTLSYNQHQVNPENVKIFSVSLRLDNSIYDGTIFDGILINNTQNRTRTYVVTDVYMFRGKNLLNDKIQYKIMNLVSYLKANLKDDKLNTVQITVNKLYDPEQLETLLNDIPTMKNYNIKGIAFYPELSGTKLIYMLDNGTRQQQQVQKPPSNNNSNRYDGSHQQRQPYVPNQQNLSYVPQKTSIRYIAKSNETVFATFELKKTKDSDVYKLYLVETVKRDGKTILKSKKMGIAYIPTTECSVMCTNSFSKNFNSRVLMLCKFINDKNKWQPIELDKVSKYPTNLSDIEKKLEILEEQCSDEDEFD